MKRISRLISAIPLTLLLIIVAVPAHTQTATSKPGKPNFIIIFTDDQGYNDLGCYGANDIRTPRIDGMAKEGLRMTSFYAQPVCGPSRGALLTGRYPLRIGGGWLTRSEEVTIAEVMQSAGYATACIGKWDISQRKFQPGLVPNDQGFDYYFGTLGANDRGKVSFHRNKDSLYETSDMSSLTRMYTDEALKFIREKKDQPFFLYLAHTMAHVVMDASSQFKGKSNRELYGDVIEEIDWNAGRIFDLLKELQIGDNTYVVFLSDNGPWSNKEDAYRKSHGQLATGSAFPLRSAKGSPYEGGFRVPCIFWGPGRIPGGRESSAIMSTLDILPTFARLAGASHPDPKKLDGIDQTKLILGKNTEGARKQFHYHVKGELQAYRNGKWKVLLPNPTMGYAYVKDPERKAPELYDLEQDISESRNLAGEQPAVLRKMLKKAAKGPNAPQNTGP